MEPILLTCMVIMYFVTKGKVDTAAYASGKESPGVAKARMRHEAGGGGHTPSGKPKGKGALRLLAASRWNSACAAVQQAGEHKAARRRKWFEETAPLRDEAWRRKQLDRLAKSDASRARWARERGLVDLSEYRDRKTGNGSEPTAGESACAKPGEVPAASSDGAKSGGPSSATPDTQTSQPTHGSQPPAGQNPEAGMTEKQRELATKIKDAWSQGKLVEPDIPYDEWFALPLSVRADLLKAGVEEGGMTFDPDFDTSARDLAGLPRKKPAHNGSDQPRPVGADTGNSDLGCRWIPRRESTPCGARRYKGSLYCAKHYVQGKVNQCLWHEDNQSEPECPNERERHERFCLAHLAIRTGQEQATSEKPATTPTPAAGAAATPDTTDKPRDMKTAAAENTPTGSAQNTTTEGASVYQEAVEQLIRQADECARYRQELSAFADTLAGKGWGEQVTGPVQDMHSRLSAAEGKYRDLAAQMGQQGNRGNEAYDQAPWVPGPEAVMA